MFHPSPRAPLDRLISVSFLMHIAFGRVENSLFLEEKIEKVGRDGIGVYRCGGNMRASYSNMKSTWLAVARDNSGGGGVYNIALRLTDNISRIRMKQDDNAPGNHRHLAGQRKVLQRRCHLAQNARLEMKGRLGGSIVHRRLGLQIRPAHGGQRLSGQRRRLPRPVFSAVDVRGLFPGGSLERVRAKRSLGVDNGPGKANGHLGGEKSGGKHGGHEFFENYVENSVCWREVVDVRCSVFESK